MPAASRSTVPDPRTHRIAVSVAIVVATMVIGVLAGFLFTVVTPKHYTGTARVLVQATGVDTTSQANTRTPNGTINLDTEAQLVTSSSVISRAAQSYKPFARVSRTRLVDDIDVTVPANTSVLTISYVDSSKAGARDGANALAGSYLSERQDAAQSQLDSQERSAQSAIDSLSASLQKLIAQEIALPAKSATKFYVGEQIGILKNRLLAENRQLVTYNSISVTPGRLVNPATRPTSPSSPSLLIGLASGAALGLLVGLLLVWLRGRFRRKVRTRDDVTAATDITCLAVLPNLSGGSAGDEQYRRLGLVAMTAAKDARRLVFTSPAASPSVATLSTGVAGALRRSGRAVALLRVNSTSAPSASATRTRGVEVVAVPSAETISTKRGESVDRALERIRADNDILVIDCPAAAERADAQTVAADADAVVIVVDIGTRTRALRAAVQSLDEVGAPVLGIVLVRGKGASRVKSAPNTTAAPPDDAASAVDDSAPEDSAPDDNAVHASSAPDETTTDETTTDETTTDETTTMDAGAPGGTQSRRRNRTAGSGAANSQPTHRAGSDTAPDQGN